MKIICARFAVFVPLLLVAAATRTTAATIQSPDENFEFKDLLGQAMKFVGQCGTRDIISCFKERALKYLDNVPGNLELTEGIILKDTSPEKDETDKLSQVSLPEEPQARKIAVDSLLMDRIAKFLASHTLQFKIPENTVAEMKRNIDADEGRRKRRKMLLPLLLLMKLKAATLLPLLLGALALISFKALVIGKVALVISGLIALKKLFENKDSSQTYEVVAHPHYSHSHVSNYGDDHHHGHYRRALIEGPQTIAYSAYVSNQQLFGTP